MSKIQNVNRYLKTAITASDGTLIVKPFHLTSVACYLDFLKLFTYIKVSSSVYAPTKNSLRPATSLLWISIMLYRLSLTSLCLSIYTLSVPAILHRSLERHLLLLMSCVVISKSYWSSPKQYRHSL